MIENHEENNFKNAFIESWSTNKSLNIFFSHYHHEGKYMGTYTGKYVRNRSKIDRCLILYVYGLKCSNSQFKITFKTKLLGKK